MKAQTLSFFCCDECGQQTDTDLDHYSGEEKRLCDECNSEYIYCNYCNDRLYKDAPCRHIFWSSEHENYAGCGHDKEEWNQHKESFFAVLNKIGVDAAKALLVALKRHQYFHQFSGTIFGYERLTADWWDELGNRVDYGDLFGILFEEKEEAMVVGVQWLTSLWAGTGYSSDDGELPKTPDADNHTAQWIEEWMKNVVIGSAGVEPA